MVHRLRLSVTTRLLSRMLVSSCSTECKGTNCHHGEAQYSYDSNDDGECFCFVFDPGDSLHKSQPGAASGRKSNSDECSQGLGRLASSPDHGHQFRCIHEGSLQCVRTHLVGRVRSYPESRRVVQGRQCPVGQHASASGTFQLLRPSFRTSGSIAARHGCATTPRRNGDTWRSNQLHLVRILSERDPLPEGGERVRGMCHTNRRMSSDQDIAMDCAARHEGT